MHSEIGWNIGLEIEGNFSRHPVKQIRLNAIFKTNKKDKNVI